MNKILIVGRLVRDSNTQQTASGIKYTRFTVAVDRQFGENQADFIPVVAWRSQAEFVEKYMTKGSLVSIEGRFTSSTYQTAEQLTVTRYEITADRVQSLETKAQASARASGNQGASQMTGDISNPSPIQFEEETKASETANGNDDVPWEIDL